MHVPVAGAETLKEADSDCEEAGKLSKATIHNAGERKTE